MSPSHPEFIAHTRSVGDQIEFQSLDEHLEGVASLASAFAARFGARQWGYLAGLWHDLGKASVEFQQYIRSSASDDSHRTEVSGRVDHSTAGAQHAVRTLGPRGHLLAYPIAGHHSGLLDAIADGANQEARLAKSVPRVVMTGHSETPTEGLELPERIVAHIENGADSSFTLAFFARMIYSCLVDADFLDTESFVEPERARTRRLESSASIDAMAAALDRYVASFGDDGSVVERARREVREACLEAGQLDPGFFSLTVPTGGGKTLSSLAFALRHAQRHGRRRIIYVIPFTSIIEQNAAVFRDVFSDLGDDAVLEHHSQVFHAPDADRDSRLAAENWDAPLIVTTTVQFYESLFANRSSRCRKLHNIADSVVILDEAQCLPVDLLKPTLRALEQLVACYGVSVVICTATQPGIIKCKEFPIGIDGVREIVTDPKELQRNFERVEVADLGEASDDRLEAELTDHDRVLCIVNTRRHAREIYERIRPHGDAFHLSAQMCPEHRSSVLAVIRGRLEAGGPCRVVSTQLIEAGVDIDFPVVYRSIAGLDSIAQAAGRCNRNGRLDGPGRLYVFRSEHAASERFLAETANVAAQVMPLHSSPLALDAIGHYFRLYYWEQQTRWDQKKILRMAQVGTGTGSKLPLLFDFKRMSEAFRLIEQSQMMVFVPWGDEGMKILGALRATGPAPPRQILRRMQRFQVGIPEREYLENCAIGSIELVHDRFAALVEPGTHYRDDIGLVLDRERGGLMNI